MSDLYEIIKSRKKLTPGEAGRIGAAISGGKLHIAAEMAAALHDCQEYITPKEYLKNIQMTSEGEPFHAAPDCLKAAQRRNIMAEIRRAARRAATGAKLYQRQQNKLYTEITEAQGLGLEIRQHGGGVNCLYLTRNGHRVTPGTIYRSNRRSDAPEDFATTVPGSHKANAMAEALKLYRIGLNPSALK